VKQNNTVCARKNDKLKLVTEVKNKLKGENTMEKLCEVYVCLFCFSRKGFVK
jgi:hypothetical protein